MPIALLVEVIVFVPFVVHWAKRQFDIKTNSVVIKVSLFMSLVRIIVLSLVSDNQCYASDQSFDLPSGAKLFLVVFKACSCSFFMRSATVITDRELMKAIFVNAVAHLYQMLFFKESRSLIDDRN